MRRLTACAVLLLLALVVPAPALAADSTEPTPSPTSTSSVEPATPEPATTQPTDGIREIPTQDDGADFYSIATILLFFAIAMGIFVFIIRVGMRAADRED